jgi:predicted metal-dependent phosphoesterase TrpH
VIDLHAHTTASDGYLDADGLVQAAWTAGVRVLAVTDHDTVAGLEAARRAAAGFGLTLVNGIELTAVEEGRDVHVLGYFFDPETPALVTCLEAQRDARRHRLRAMAERLAGHGVPVDADALLAAWPAHRALGRPALAEAMVAAGHVQSTREAFDRWIGQDAPAWVRRDGLPVGAIVEVIHAAGGLASLAHPVLYGRDGEVARWREAGLDAIEVHHSEHLPADVEHYRAMAGRLGMLITGGSDFHGDPPGRPGRARPRILGHVTLPDADFARLREAHRGRTSARPTEPLSL